jgi:hypothetical protein
MKIYFTKSMYFIEFNLFQPLFSKYIISFRKYTFWLLIILLFSCEKKVDYYHLPISYSANNINAVIEIPAGTSKEYGYNKKSQSFTINKKNGKDRIINSLPYIGNYGFIPSTYSDPKTRRRCRCD